MSEKKAIEKILTKIIRPITPKIQLVRGKCCYGPKFTVKGPRDLYSYMHVYSKVKDSLEFGLKADQGKKIVEIINLKNPKYKKVDCRYSDQIEIISGENGKKIFEETFIKSVYSNKSKTRLLINRSFHKNLKSIPYNNIQIKDLTKDKIIFNQEYISGCIFPNSENIFINPDFSKIVIFHGYDHGKKISLKDGMSIIDIESGKVLYKKDTGIQKVDLDIDFSMLAIIFNTTKGPRMQVIRTVDVMVLVDRCANSSVKVFLNLSGSNFFIQEKRHGSNENEENMIDFSSIDNEKIFSNLNINELVTVYASRLFENQYNIRKKVKAFLSVFYPYLLLMANNKIEIEERYVSKETIENYKKLAEKKKREKDRIVQILCLLFLFIFIIEI